MSCLTEVMGSNVLMAPRSTGCADNHRQTPCSALGLQGACSILRAGKSKVANPNLSSRVAHGPPVSFPTLCGIFPKIYAIQKAKLVQRFYSLPQKTEYPTLLGKNPFCSSWKRLLISGSSDWLEDPLISCCGVSPVGKVLGTGPDILQMLCIPCWHELQSLGQLRSPILALCKHFSIALKCRKWSRCNETIWPISEWLPGPTTLVNNLMNKLIKLKSEISI